MNTHSRAGSLFFILLVSLTACTFSVGVESPPTVDRVATVVSMTMQVDTPVINTPAVNTPEATTDLLPHSLYFLGKDSQSLTQVFRLERDGRTLTQLTSEPVDVLDYDVSLHDGSLVFEIDNQLILVNADGSNRRVLQENAPTGRTRGFFRPVFSPDGQTLAYSAGGLTLYNVASGGTNLAVANRTGDDALPRESYVPDKFSPDGTKLLIYMLHSDTSSVAIYDLPTNALVLFPNKDDGDFACCGLYREVAWAPDGLSFYSSNPYPGVDAGGLWRVNATTGDVTTIVPYGGGNNSLNFVDEPFAAPDGQLYYFYSNYSGDLGPVHRAPVDLEIIRSAPDGVTGRTSLLRSENLRMMNEALWAPNASFVISAMAPSEDVIDGGRAEIVYFDGRPNVVLAPFAQTMKWGP